MQNPNIAEVLHNTLQNKRGLIFTFNVASLIEFHLEFLRVEANTSAVDVISPINCAGDETGFRRLL